jgi:hypothetical protein
LLGFAGVSMPSIVSCVEILCFARRLLLCGRLRDTARTCRRCLIRVFFVVECDAKVDVRHTLRWLVSRNGEALGATFPKEALIITTPVHFCRVRVS